MRTEGRSKMSTLHQSYHSFTQFNNHKQVAEMHPTEKNTFRTMFIVMDHIAKRARIIGETNWLVGEVPPTIQIAHPVFLAKIRSGNMYNSI